MFVTTISDVLKEAMSFLKKKDNKRKCEELLAHVLQIKREELFFKYNQIIDTNVRNEFNKLLLRLEEGEPLEYILGKVFFYNVDIEVNRDVLIPRIETEELVEKIGEELKRSDLSNKTLCDLCTGSGCIAIALKRRFPSLIISASDISGNALTVAYKNAFSNNVNINFERGDLLEPFRGKKFDFITCNPPYVSKKEYDDLQAGLKFEPVEALIAENEGFYFYEKLANLFPFFLKPKGRAFFEIGYTQGEVVKKMFSKDIWKKADILQDLAGHDRFFFLEIE